MFLSSMEVQVLYLRGPSAMPLVCCEPNLECPASFLNVGTPEATMHADSFTSVLFLYRYFGEHVAGLEEDVRSV